MASFGKQVAADRKQARMTQEQLRVLMNKELPKDRQVSRQWIANLENNLLKKDVGMADRRKALATALKTDQTHYLQLPLQAPEAAPTGHISNLPLDAVFSGSPRPSLKVNVVGSPKGGVGRTLLLVHAALIQATGCKWAGLPCSFPLALDFDFNAPGIHTYPLRDAGHWTGGAGEQGEWTYRTLNDTGISQRGLDLHLKSQPLGLVFFLQSISEYPLFMDCRDLLWEGADEPNYGPAIQKMTEFILQQSGLLESPVNLLRHLVAVTDATGQPRLAFFPAGSPRNLSFAKTANTLRWSELIANGMGLVMINSLLNAVATLGNQASSDKQLLGLLRPIDEVWIDQSPGQSVATAAHERLATRRVLVSSLAPQSSEALAAWIAAMEEKERSTTWVNLTFYRARQLPAGRDNYGPDALSYALIDQAARHFKDADNERLHVMDMLEQAGIDKTHVGIADFEPDLVNNQCLRGPDSEYYNSVVPLLMAMNMDQKASDAEAKRGVGASPMEISILGEYVGNPQRPAEANPSGVLKALFDWLKKSMPNASISGVALSHEDIVRLAGGESMKIWFKDYGFKSREPSLVAGESTRPTEGKYYAKTIKLSDFDMAAIPSYAVDDRKHLISSFAVADLESLNVFSFDHRGPIGGAYLSNKIRAWSETLCPDKEAAICGVPIFSHFPLIVSNRADIDHSSFRTAFKARAHKLFVSMLSFADIRNAAIVSLAPNLGSCRLIMATDKVARVYEWLLVLGIEGCNPFPTHDVEGKLLTDLLTEDMVFESTLDYALLNYLALSNKEGRLGWNEAMTKIFHRQAGFMFVWPDAIFEHYRKRDLDEFAYSPIPAEFQLNETWLLTIPEAKRVTDKQNMLWTTLIRLMTPEAQFSFTDFGGVPVHSTVGADPKIWRTSPVARILGLTRRVGYHQNTISVPRRAFNATKIMTLGNILEDFCAEFSKQADDHASGLDWRAALRISQNPYGSEAASLKSFWSDNVKTLNSF